MERFAGKKWKDIEENDKKELLENAICRDCRVGSPLLNGEDMVAFLQKHLQLFDIVRIHKFGEQDDKAEEGTDAGKLPSFKAMSDFAVSDEQVKITLARRTWTTCMLDKTLPETSKWIKKNPQRKLMLQ